MKKIFCLLTVAFALCFAGCSTARVAAAKSSGPELKVGFFVDDGSRGGGVFQVARLLFHSPQLDVTMLDGKDIRDGALDKLDLLVIPGGSSAAQFKAMRASGAAKVREFVRNGGSYVGVCAGFHCTLNRPDRIALLPYVYVNKTSGAQGTLSININEAGAKILDVKPGKYNVYYSQGPISRAGKNWKHGSAEVLGTYLNSIGLPGRKHYDYTGHPAILFGNHGKGKVVATSFHPEVNVVNHCIFNGMVYAVTGKKITQDFPEKNPRPVRCVLYVGDTKGKARISRLLELDRHPDIDVKPLAAGSVPDAVSGHADVLVTMASDSKPFRSFVDRNKVIFRNFMDRGGRIIAAGSGINAFEKHPNLIGVPNGKSFVDAVLNRN